MPPRSGRIGACVTLLLLVMNTAAAGQDCGRDQIGLDPVRPSLTTAQWNAGLSAASHIVPRLGNGAPSSSGKVYVLAIGMSNTGRVWKGFSAVANQSGVLHKNVKLINGAYAGKAASDWADPANDVWTRLIGTKLANLGVSPSAIAAVYIMVTNDHPTLAPAENAELFKARVRAIRQNLDAKGFTNRKIDYLAPNYYGGYDVGQDKTPEPHVYYEGLTMQALQDEATGPVWVSAVPGYQWADGVRPRPWDGLTLLCEDVDPDGVHLSKDIGVPKYGQRLFDALRADPTSYGWLW